MSLSAMQDMAEAPPRIQSMRVWLSASKPRRKPRIGDRRVTKQHGLQLRVVCTHDWMWMRSGSRYLYEWRSPAELIGTRWEYLVRGMLPRIS